MRSGDKDEAEVGWLLIGMYSTAGEMIGFFEKLKDGDVKG